MTHTNEAETCLKYSTRNKTDLKRLLNPGWLMKNIVKSSQTRIMAL